MTSSLYISMLSIIFIGLSVNVILARRRFKIPLNDGSNFELQRRLRAHANFAEYTPIFLIMLISAEHEGASTLLIHCIGALFITGRILHAYSLTSAEKYKDGVLLNKASYRVKGMACTFSSIGLLCVVLLSYVACL